MSTVLPPKSALLLSAITISAVDGELDPNEVAIINRMDGLTTSADWELAIGVWDETPLEQCIQLVAASLNEKQQRVAMANMVDIAMADGSLHESENVLLRAYSDAFQVEDKEIERIVDVITLKNDKSAF